MYSHSLFSAEGSQMVMPKCSRENTVLFKKLDVFAQIPFSGNGLTVFYTHVQLNEGAMLKLSQEMKNYESIFIQIDSNNPRQVIARIFTQQEEIEFAGHPILGAAIALHDWLLPEHYSQEEEWSFVLKKKSVKVTTQNINTRYVATMNQGAPLWGPTLHEHQYLPILDILNLTQDNLYPNGPIIVASTGFPYLIIPLSSGIDKALILSEGLDELLAPLGAKEVYLFDISGREGRNWDNHVDTIEDIATGSAAGIAAAYLIRHGMVSSDQELIIRQGRFLNRSSEMRVIVDGSGNDIHSVKVSGDVIVIAEGEVDQRLIKLLTSENRIDVRLST